MTDFFEVAKKIVRDDLSRRQADAQRREENKWIPLRASDPHVPDPAKELERLHIQNLGNEVQG